MLPGKVLPISGVADSLVGDSGQEGESKAVPILLIDDGLRRTFVPKQHLVEVIDQAPENMVRIELWQNVARAGGTIGSVGPSLRIDPFDKFGRRIYQMQTRDGPLSVVQGITELTPRYVKVEGLLGQPKSIVWDMRLATSSIPRKTLDQILDTAVSKENADDWLQVVRFYLQGERYQDARRELEEILRHFPEKQELQAEVRQLRKLGARRILREINLRRDAGQHELVSHLLENFPTEEVAGEMLQQVRELLQSYQRSTERIAEVSNSIDSVVAKIGDPDHRDLAKSIVEEITSQLTHNNIDRLTPFVQLVDDDTLTADQKVALAITGWLLGGENAMQKLPVAISLVNVREMVNQYLSEPLAHERDAILQSVRSMEGASVQRVAQMLAHLKPPWEIPDGSDRKFGYYELLAPGRTEHGDFRYLVQLPPEYDPTRHYPTILALNGAYNSAQQELDFWAGSQQRNADGEVAGPRRGQAMRHGFITIAVDWQKPQQSAYEYSLREHEAVLTCLRDACRRFGIDTNRVFLTGHGLGGDATWDFALAHPDVWAGAIPFVARARKYVPHYWDNAEYVPFYFVAGELDGKKMSQNAPVLNKFLRERFETTVVEFLGRGQEPFQDEIHNLFDWMGRHIRARAPKEFSCKTMRPWDNFFWWIEGRDFPGTVAPSNWPQRSARPTEVQGKRLANNGLAARTASKQTTIWLSPDVVDFSAPVRVTLNGRRVTSVQGHIQPQLEVLLEDVRTRADRLRPFWAKLEVSAKR